MSDFKTIGDTGKAPGSRVIDYQSASCIVENVITAAGERNRKGAMIKGMFDGNKPYNDAKLRSKGMAHYPNFNSLEGKSYLSNAMVPYYDLVAGGNSLVEVALDIPDPGLQGEWSRTVSEELERTMRKGTWFEVNMNKMCYDFVGFGKAFFTWSDPVEWRFQHTAWHRFYWPDQTDVDPDKWDYFVIERTYTVHDLYKRVRNAQSATKAGWDVNAVLDAIRGACSKQAQTDNDWFILQQQLKDHDLSVSSGADTIFTAWLWVKEFDGKWSLIIVPRSGNGSNKSAPQTQGKQGGLLYKKTGIYDDVLSAIAPFFFEMMDGSVNGLSGLGKDIYAPMVVKDKFNCATTNSAFLRSSLILQPRTGSARQKAAIALIGSTCVVPEGYEVLQSNMLGDIASTIAVGQDFDRRLQSNTGIYRPAFEKQQGNPATAKEVELRFTQGSILSSSAVNRFHVQLDRCYLEMYRRLVKASDEDARQFRQWCVQRGVPEQVLGRVRSVRSYRSFGNGNPFMRQNNISALMPFFPEFPEPGKQAFVEDAVAAFTSQAKVERYYPRSARPDVPSRDTWEAMVENSDIHDGAPVTWTPYQDDIVHLEIHAKAIVDALGSIQQGGSPQDVLIFCQAVLNHVTSHIQSLQRKQRKQQVQQWEQQYQAIAKQVNQLARMVQQQQGQQQKLQQKAQKVLTDADVKAMSAQARIQLQTQKQQATQALQTQQALHEAKLKDLRASQELEINRLKATQDLNIKAGHARIDAASSIQDQMLKKQAAEAPINGAPKETDQT